MSGLEIASSIGGLVSASIAIGIHLYGLKNQFETSFRVIDYLIVEMKLIQGYFQELKDSYDTAEFSSLQTSRDAERMEIYEVMVEEIRELVDHADAALNGKSKWSRGKEQIKLMNGTLNEIRDRMRGLQNHILTGHAIFLNRLTTSNTLEQRGAILTGDEREPDVVVPKIDMRNLQQLDKRDRLRMQYAKAVMEEDEDDDWGESAPKRTSTIMTTAIKATTIGDISYPVGFAELPSTSEKRNAQRSSMAPPPVPLKIPEGADSPDSPGNASCSPLYPPYVPYRPVPTPPSSVSSPGTHFSNPFGDPPPQHRRAYSASSTSPFQSPYNHIHPPSPFRSPGPQSTPSPGLPSQATPGRQPHRTWSSSASSASLLPYPDETAGSPPPLFQMPPIAPFIPQTSQNHLSRSTSGASRSSGRSQQSAHWNDEDAFY